MRRAAFLLGLVIMLSIVWIRGQDDGGGPLYALPNATTPFFASNTIARTDDGRTLVAANSLNDSVSFINLRESALAIEITVGDDPRGVAYTPDEDRVLVVNRADGTLYVIDLTGEEPEIQAQHPVGLQPQAVVTDDDSFAYVALQGTNEVVRVDLNTGAILDRIPTPAFPAGLLLWGDFLYVTHFWDGNLSLIYLPQMTVVRTVDTGGDTSLFPSLALDPTAGVAYLPQSRSHAMNRALTYDNTVLPIVNAMDLGSLSVQRSERIALGYVDQPVNMPFNAVLDRNTLYVINAGSNDVSVIDIESGLSVGNVEVGANPRGVLLSRDRSQVYVHNVIDGTLSIIETNDLRVSDVLPISDVTIPADILLGAELFHAADDPRLSNNEWMSCASCHFDGQSDGQVWRGFPGGARNTPVLYDLLNTAPYNWSATWDELADVEVKIRRLQAGEGLIDGQTFPPLSGDFHAGLSPDLDTLVAYLVSLTGPESPILEDSIAVERGEAVFSELECAVCHTGETFIDGLSHDVGTGGEFDTPTLRWLWQSAPYYHDGRAETLLDVFTLPGAHQLISDVPLDDINALIAYLLSLPQPSE